MGMLRYSRKQYSQIKPALTLFERSFNLTINNIEFIISKRYICGPTNEFFPMGRGSRKEIRQKEIIEGYYNVAKLEGLENTSIAKIAKDMGINPSLIIHYFQTKEDLTKGLIEYILDKYSEIYHVPSSRKAKRLAKLKFVIDNLISKKWDGLVDNGLYFSGYALVFRDPVIKEQYKALQDQLRNILAALIQECIDNDEVIVKDANKAAQLIYMMVDGAYFYLSVVTEKKEFDQKLRLYRKHAYQFLGI